jgi:hypothetical protein
MKATLFAIAMVTGTASAQSPTIDEGIGKARQMIHESNGWKAFRARNDQFYSCFAYKLAEGEEDGRTLPTGSGMAIGLIGGNTRGFKIYIKDSSNQFEYGLFGKEFYSGTAAIEANGQIFRAIYSFGDLKVSQLLQFEGVRVEAEISTYQYRSHLGRKDFYSGHIDFTGIRAAHAALAECHKSKSSI